MFEVSVHEKFAAGHSLRNYHGKCENVHGHNYKVKVTLVGEKLDENGLLVDFAILKKVLRKAVAYLDHQFINDLPPFDVWNPSAENIALYFGQEIQKGVDEGMGLVPVRIKAVRVWETDTSVATYRPK